MKPIDQLCAQTDCRKKKKLLAVGEGDFVNLQTTIALSIMVIDNANSIYGIIGLLGKHH